VKVSAMKNFWYSEINEIYVVINSMTHKALKLLQPIRIPRSIFGPMKIRQINDDKVYDRLVLIMGGAVLVLLLFAILSL